MAWKKILSALALSAVVLTGGTAVAPAASAVVPKAAAAPLLAAVSSTATTDVPFSTSARWIWNSTDTADQWVAFRKSFTLSAKPSTAVTYIAADTHYWLYVNGTLVTFEGGAKRGPDASNGYADTIDLAPYLVSGQNNVSLLVWHLGKSGFSHRDSGAAGLLFQSQIVTSGGQVSVFSDSSWKQTQFPGYVHDTSGTQPNSRLSEWNVSYDARLAGAMAGWNATTFDDSAWSAAVDRGAAGAAPWNRLVPRGIPPYKFSGLKEYTNSASLPTTGDGSTIRATLPSNLQVTPYLKIDAPAGKTITIQTDHYWDGGEVNVRATYISTGGVQEFEALGWMSGTTVEYTIPSGVTVQALRYRESGYNTEFAGSFTTNDPFFNTLWAKLQRTIYVNMRDTFMDTPGRERAPWGGDIVVDQLATPYMFDQNVNLLLNKNIRQQVGWQTSAGELYSPFGANPPLVLPIQGLAGVYGYAQHYANSGDASALDNTTYQAVKKYLNLWSFDSDGLVTHRTGSWDWLDWGSNIDTRVIDNAWYVKALDAAITLANLTGNSGDVSTWQQRRDSISNNFDRVLWNGTTREYRSPGYTGDTDDRGNALAVSAGLASPSRYADIANVLRGHYNASPYMETFVIEALYKMKRPVEAQQRLMNRYAAEVNDPGYTLWELWSKGGSGTDNHGWNGAPAMLSIYGAGARATSPGWSTFDVAPQLGSFTKISTTVPTPKGNLGLAIDATNPSSYTTAVTSPPGTTGRIGIPRRTDPQTVTVNGTTVYQNGAAAGGVSGVSFAGEQDGYLFFTVTPGTWQFSSTGTAAATTPTVGTGWVNCAPEGVLCRFDGAAQVRYGAGTSFVTTTLSNGTPCTTAAFGSDPANGVLKHCEVYVDQAAPTGTVKCADEGGKCAFSGTVDVSFGAAGKFNTKTLTDGTNCTNDVFGDPIYGSAKSCYRGATTKWSLCATEGSTCLVPGTYVVRYGSARAATAKVVSSSIGCSNFRFGTDPANGSVKDCRQAPLPTATGSPWKACADEGGTCTISGSPIVAYGAGQSFVVRQVSANFTCGNATFGDPISGTAKKCWVLP